MANQEEQERDEDIPAVRERLMTMIRTGQPLSAIEALVRQRREVLTTANAEGWLPLHHACSFGVSSPKVIRLLVELGPAAVEMIDESGYTPFHLACMIQNASIEVAKVLIDANPSILTMLNNFGRTPLHLSCVYQRQSTDILEFLVDRSPERVLGLTDNAGWAPLHRACHAGVATKIIQKLIKKYSRALRLVTKNGFTALHNACRSRRTSMASIRLLVEAWPVSCLRLRFIPNHTPLDIAIAFRRRETELVAFLANATKDAGSALFACALGKLSTLPENVYTRIRTALTKSTDGKSRRRHFYREVLHSLLRCADLQAWLDEDANQELICGAIRLIKAGHRRAQEGNKLQGVRVLEAVVDLPDCLYLHLRGNPSLCNRQGIRKRQRDSSASMPPAKRTALTAPDHDA
jgi:26S proteasome non-ATPase regulatory subunit 10